MTSRMWKSYIIKILHEEWESENYKFCTEIQIIGIYALEVLLAKFFSQKKKTDKKEYHRLDQLSFPTSLYLNFTL